MGGNVVNGLTGSFQLMKSLNKSLILNVIRTQGPISRAEIAKRTNLTPPTVTNLVGELLDSQLIVESQLGTSTGGRKPILLRIHTEAFHVIGIDVGSSRIKIIATHLDGQIMDSFHLDLPKPLSQERFLNNLRDGVLQMMGQTGISKETLIGIGIAMHGLVNPEKGYSIFAPNFGFRDIALREILEKELGSIPVEVENDVRAMALGESWFGNGKGVRDFICINVGMGIGAGLIIDHKLYHGSSYTAGELGHTTIEIEGPLCSCGNRGCLQALAAGPAIARKAILELETGKQSILKELVNRDTSLITGEMVYAAAQQGDKLARDVLAEAGRYLGVGIANIMNTFNPMKVILGGGVVSAGEYVMEPLLATVQARSLHMASEDVVIQTTKLGDHATAIGAATLVLKKLFIPDLVTG